MNVPLIVAGSLAHPRRRHPRSRRRGARGEEAVAGNAAVQSLRRSADDQDDDPRHVAPDDRSPFSPSDPRCCCQARSSTAIPPGRSACSPPARPPASRRSRWGWGLPTRNPLDPCSATPVPSCSPPPRCWRGGELSKEECDPPPRSRRGGLSARRRRSPRRWGRAGSCRAAPRAGPGRGSPAWPAAATRRPRGRARRRRSAARRR